MNDQPKIEALNEPTLEEKKAAVQEAIRNQIESIRAIAKDMDENEARVASAILMLNTAQQFNLLSMQIEQLTRALAQFTQPTLVRPDGAPLVH